MSTCNSRRRVIVTGFVINGEKSVSFERNTVSSLNDLCEKVEEILGIPSYLFLFYNENKKINESYFLELCNLYENNIDLRLLVKSSNESGIIDVCQKRALNKSIECINVKDRNGSVIFTFEPELRSTVGNLQSIIGMSSHYHVLVMTDSSNKLIKLDANELLHDLFLTSNTFSNWQ